MKKAVKVGNKFVIRKFDETKDSLDQIMRAINRIEEKLGMEKTKFSYPGSDQD